LRDQARWSWPRSFRKIWTGLENFLASPLERRANSGRVLAAAADLHPSIFNEGILSGTISITQISSIQRRRRDPASERHLQNAPLDRTREWPHDRQRRTWPSKVNAATKDVDLSMKGDVDFRSTNDLVLRISSTTPIFGTHHTSVQDCVRGIQISPVDATLAPTVQEIEIRGDLFGNA